jgi:hypothetical protein
MPFSRRGGHWAAVVAVLAFGLQIAAVAHNPHKYEWDMRCYYYAERAFAAGLDPYVIESHRAVAEPGNNEEFHPFIYPPQTLIVFWPLGQLPYRWAFYLDLLFDITTLTTLLWAGSLWLGDRVRRHWYLLLAPFAFNGAMAWCLRTGNVALFESALLTGGLLAFARQRWATFVACTTAAATFKLLPIVLLALLVPSRAPRKVLLLSSGLGVIVIVNVLGRVLAPGLFAEFLSHTPPIGSLRGPIDESLASAIVDVFALAHPGSPRFWPLAVYTVAACAGASATVLGVWRLVTRGAPEHHFVRLVVLAYLAFCPRLLGYSFSLAVAPVVSVIIEGSPWRRWWMGFAMIFATAYISRFVLHQPDIRSPTWLMLPWDYLGSLTVLAAWGMAARAALRHDGASDASHAEGRSFLSGLLGSGRGGLEARSG